MTEPLTPTDAALVLSLETEQALRQQLEQALKLAHGALQREAALRARLTALSQKWRDIAASNDCRSAPASAYESAADDLYAVAAADPHDPPATGGERS